MGGTNVEFAANGGTAPGYLTIPESGSGPAVVVLQEWWGLVPHIRDVCDRFAADGFVALAPDLYRGAETDQPDEAQQRMMALSMEQTEKDLRGAITYLLAHEATSGDRVGSVGFCLGGGLSVFAASLNTAVGAVSSYYYVLPHGKPDFSAIKAPVLMHFGAADDFVSVDDANALVEEMRTAGVDVTAEFYDGCGHAFFNDTNRLGTYNAEAASRSWRRTVEFLTRNLDA